MCNKFIGQPLDGDITWYVDESQLPENMTKDRVLFCFERAFGIISKYFQSRKFYSVKSGAVVEIKFRKNGDPDLPVKFMDKQIAFALPPGDTLLASDLFVNLEKNFSELHNSGHFNLTKILVHELLHCLGFGHSENPKCILYEKYVPSDEIYFCDELLSLIRLKYGVKYDLQLIKEWIREGDFLYLHTNRDIIRLGNYLGLNLDPRHEKNYNIHRIKKYLYGS